MLCGVAVVEDQHERTAVLEVVRPSAFFAREAELLSRARDLLPRLPFDQLDVLVVDELGKDVSGAGMDTNVIGRVSFWGGGERPARPRITRILVRGLTAATRGNACGIGMADFITARCAAAVDRAATGVNCVTSNCPEDARLPIACASDREALAACLQTSGVTILRRYAWPGSATRRTWRGWPSPRPCWTRCGPARRCAPPDRSSPCPTTRTAT